MSEFRRRLMMAGSGETDYSKIPLTLTALEDGAFTFTILSDIDTADCQYVEYSLNGINWVKTNNVASTEVTITTPTILEGNKVYWRGYGYRYGTNSNNVYSHFASTGEFSISGNISSMILGPNFENATEYRRRNSVGHMSNKRIFYGLFINCINLISAKELILPNISFNSMNSVYDSLFRGCTGLTDASFELPTVINERNEGNYSSMFYGCSSLVIPPIFMMKTASFGDFANMFYKCTSLTTAPDISSITSINSSCFNSMFYGCSKITQPAKMSQFTTVYSFCFNAMYNRCSNLTTAPVLPAETLVSSCYAFMLTYCPKLTWVKMLATDISASNCLNRWMEQSKNTSDCIFIKHINATWTTTGNSGVPSNWTIIYYDPALDKYYTDQTRATECDDHGNPIT